MRKLTWIGTIVVFLLGVVWLTLFSTAPLASSTAGEVSEGEYMKRVTATQEGQSTFIQMVTGKVLEKEYGNKVSKKDLDKQFDAVKAQYGSNFNTILNQTGQTADEFKNNIKQGMLLTEAIKDTQKFSDQQLQEAYDQYRPSMSVSIISVNDSDTANTVLVELNDGADFADTAKKYSTDESSAKNGGVVPAFDSTSTALPSSVVEAASKLEVGDYTTEAVSNGTSYSIIKLNSVAKKQGIETYKSILENKLANDWKADRANNEAMQRMIGSIMKKHKVQLRANQYTGLKKALDDYIINSSKTTPVQNTNNDSK